MFDRKKIINEIGKLKPSIVDDQANQLSYFIIPFSHSLLDDKKPLDLFLSSMNKKWKLKNNDFYISKKQKLNRKYSQIKEYVFENLLPSNSEENRHKEMNFLFELKDLPTDWTLEIGSQLISFKFTGLDLWMMDHNIAFFVLKTEAFEELDTLSSVYNRNMREYRDLYLDFEHSTIGKMEDSKVHLLDALLELIDQKQDRLEINSIDNSSNYAKMLTAVHIDEDQFRDNSLLEPDSKEAITFDLVHQVSILDETSYLLATTSNLFPDKTYEHDDGYLYDIVSQAGINVWKYWAGIAVQDSLAFFSSKHGGIGIVKDCKKDIYLMYILNLYINYRLKIYEEKVIDNNFIEIGNIYATYQSLLRLKNEYVAKEVAIRFQLNLINQKIIKGLGTDLIYDEVSENIKETLEATRNNKDIFIGIYVVLFTGVGFFVDTKDLVNKNPLETFLVFIVILFILVVAYNKRRKSMNLLKKLTTFLLKKLHFAFVR